MIILYQNEYGTAVIYPNPECCLSIEQIARKDVPQGVAYRIVEDDAEAESVTFDTPDGHGDPEGYWAEQEIVL